MGQLENRGSRRGEGNDLRVVTDSRNVHPAEMDTGDFAAPPLTVRAHGQTDIGQRETNQDHFLIANLLTVLEVEQASGGADRGPEATEQGHLLAVADGMGGHAGGAEASALAIDGVKQSMRETLLWLFHLRGPEEDLVLAELHRAMGEIDSRLIGEGDRRPELRGMGTTLTFAFLLGRALFVAHVGDCRCYLLRDRTLYRLTRDHTVVDDLVRRGFVAAADAERHPCSHMLTSSLGGGRPGATVDVHKLAAEPGDRLLLCSDGLTRGVPDGQLLAVLGDEPDPAAACRRLVRLAKEAGGKDNITAIVADVSLQ